MPRLIRPAVPVISGSGERYTIPVDGRSRKCDACGHTHPRWSDVTTELHGSYYLNLCVVWRECVARFNPRNSGTN